MDLNSYLTQTGAHPAAAAATVADSMRPAAVPDGYWQELAPVEFLPNGQPVKVTLRRALIMTDVFGAGDVPFSSVLSAVFLYLCAHEAAVWSVPVEVAPRDIRPLWRAPEQLCDEALTWADAALAGMLPAEVVSLAARLWVWHDATRVRPQKKTAGNGGMSQMDHSLTDGSSGSGSPPPEMSADGGLSSMTSPSGMSTPPCTANSSAAASPAPPTLTTSPPQPGSIPN
jgi:hypothetical protein